MDLVVLESFFVTRPPDLIDLNPRDSDSKEDATTSLK